MKIEARDDVPLPKRRQTGLTPALKKLEVGGSVVSHSKDHQIHSVIRHVCAMFPGRVYETRVLDGNKGTGIWRTK